LALFDGGLDIISGVGGVVGSLMSPRGSGGGGGGGSGSPVEERLLSAAEAEAAAGRGGAEAAAGDIALLPVAGGSLRTSTRPTLNRRAESARLYEHSPRRLVMPRYRFVCLFAMTLPRGAARAGGALRVAGHLEARRHRLTPSAEQFPS
jgi:hypothetical protein